MGIRAGGLRGADLVLGAFGCVLLAVLVFDLGYMSRRVKVLSLDSRFS